MMKQNNIRKKYDKITSKISSLTQQLCELREECPHENITYKYFGSNGNYDTSANSYGIDWHCQDCDKRFTTLQDINELRKYLNARKIHT